MFDRFVRALAVLLATLYIVITLGILATLAAILIGETQ